MKILFVSGGNTEGFGIPPLITVQGNSLEAAGIQILYFTILGKGVFGYLKNLKKLNDFIKKNNVNIVHAHYSYAGLLVSLAKPRVPVVVSLLGSDVNGHSFIKKLILKLIKYLSWDVVIVKSSEMSQKVDYDNYIIPNGVNIEMFKPINKVECQKKLGWDPLKKHILFAADPQRPEKNFKLTKEAIDSLENSNIVIHLLKTVEHIETPIWYNASDLIVLSSLWEGSPNVIIEAMACNRPIVSTNVGDVKWLFGSEQGHYLAELTKKDFTEKIILGLDYSEKFVCTNGRKRLFDLNLDSNLFAKKIIGIYKSLV